MLARSLLLCLAAVALACTTTPDDGAESTGAGASTDPSTGAASGASTGPASAASESSAADPTTGDATGPADPTTGGPVTGNTVTEATTTDATATAESSGGSTTGAPAVSFTEVYEQVIMPNGCNAGYCHGGGAGGLEMTDEATAYANLVEVTATTALCDQSMRVVPGSIEASILWYRVRPAAQDNGMACAPKMPQGSMGLTDAEAKLVDDWISGGALE